MTPDAGPDVCSPLHGRPADLRPEHGHRPTCCRPTARSSSPGDRTICSRSRSRARSHGISGTSCTTCRRGWRSVARPRSGPTCCGRPSSSPMRSCSTAMPTTLNFGRGSVTLAYRPVGFEGRIARLTADHRAQLRRDRACRSPRSRSSRSHRSRRRACRRTTDPCKPAEFDNLPRSSCSTSSRAPGSGCPTSRAGPSTPWTRRPATSIRRRERCCPVRQRRDRQRRVLDRRVDQRGHRMSAIVRTEGLVKRYDRTLAVAGIDLAIDQGEIFGLVGPERRRQDDDAADARDAAAARRPGRPRSPAGRSPGTPTRCVASSASCRTRSGSTTT